MDTPQVEEEPNSNLKASDLLLWKRQTILWQVISNKAEVHKVEEALKMKQNYVLLSSKNFIVAFYYDA